MSQRSFALDPRFAAVPDADAAAPPAGRTSRRIATVLLLVGVTFGQRLCFPLMTFQISLCVPLAFLAVYLLIASGQIRINTVGFLLYALTVAMMVATLYIGKDSFSPFSFIYLVSLYLIYVFSVDVAKDEYLGYLSIFQMLLVPLALIALAQYAEQVFLGSTFSLLADVPKDYLLLGYNTRPTLGYGSTFYKSNGEFFLEPSFLSQYMAIGIIIEIIYFRKWWRAGLFGLAIYASFSGTGMVLLALFAALGAIKLKRYELLYALPVLVVLYLVFQDNPYVTAITGRVDEFDQQSSSAFIRFVGPNQALEDLIYPDFLAFLFGKGPGVVDTLGKSLSYVANFPVMHKILIEYGIFGLVPFMSFILYRYFCAIRSHLLSGALLVMYLFLSGALLQPHTLYLSYVLVILFPRQEGEAA
jgi:uncharacterized membrane protein